MASLEKGGAVDQSGRVYGVRKLGVCDASILPTVPASNTMWTTAMVAERTGASIRDGRDLAATERPRL
jgi:choline dehydrogenase-like flavoprotein